MLNIKYHRQFIKQFKKIPDEIQKKLIGLENIFQINPLEPRLRCKKLAGKLKNKYSFRITGEYRLIFEFISDKEALFLNIEHRKDIYKN
ncbi:hypothetical protein COY07_03715 [Candidatus Peregrinibacteria bacterium CG_4_10_14_0_2_um_filter_43_11]|nr:MAG: hypothetical protein COY07_03715 [Candidatus Peregrinibacteria bacterium CG_4_10_14_0_2_um_filter_43_11]